MSEGHSLRQGPTARPPLLDPRAWPRRIYLVRHGTSVWNEQQRVTGQADPPLSMRGICQAETLRTLVQDLPLDAIYCSNLQRSRETAIGVAESHRLPLLITPQLREQHFGLLQGTPRDHCVRSVAELRSQLRKNRVEFRPPGRGESFLDLDARLREWLRATLIRHRDETLLIVGHRNVNRMLFALLLGWPYLKALELPISSDWLHLIEPAQGMRLSSLSLRERDRGTAYGGFQF